MTSFSPQSLLIEIEADLPGDLQMLTRPADHHPALSRKVFHETLHFWQLVSRPFLWSMAGEDLARLQRFESSGAVLPPGPLRAEFTRTDTSLGITAEHIHEAVARYWDVHVIGPHLLLELEFEDDERVWPDDITIRYVHARDAGLLTRADGSYSDVAFDLAMAAAAGTYAGPYKLLRSIMPPSEAATVFPLVGMLAFRSRRPTWMFHHLTLACRGAIPVGSEIHELWGRSWPIVCGLADSLLNEEGEPLDFSRLGLEGDAEPCGKAHGWLSGLYAHALTLLGSDPDHLAGAPPDPQTAASRLACQFAVPGDPDARGFLIRHFPPPLVALGPTQWLPPDDLPKDEPGLEPETDPRELAAHIESMQQRMRAFTRASIHTGLLPATRGTSPGDHAIASTVDAVLRVSGAQDNRVLNWVFEVLAGDDGGDFFLFCDRHLTGTLDSEDARNAMTEIAYQLANNSSLRCYDSERGVERDWRANLGQLVLSSAALMMSARGVDQNAYTDLTAALHLRVLEWLLDVGVDYEEPLLTLLRTRVDVLAGLVPSEYRLEVESMLDHARRSNH